MKWLENISAKIGRICGAFVGGIDSDRCSDEIKGLVKLMLEEGFQAASGVNAIFVKNEGDVILIVKPDAKIRGFRVAAMPAYQGGEYLWSRAFKWKDFSADEVRNSFLQMRQELAIEQRGARPLN